MAEAVAPAEAAQSDPGLQAVIDTLRSKLPSEDQPDAPAQPDDPKTLAETTAPQMDESVQPPESVEDLQTKIDTIHLNEAGTIATKILQKKAGEITGINPNAGQWEKAASKYNNIQQVLALEGNADLRFDQNGKSFDYLPFSGIDGEPIYVKLQNGEYVPSFFTDPDSIALAGATKKDGDFLICTEQNKADSTHRVKIQIVADAQMHFMIEADDKANYLTDSEVAVITAYDQLAQNGDQSLIQDLYQGDATDIKEAARNIGVISADSVRIYLDKIYKEITPDPGMELTAEQKAHNSAVQRKKEAVIRSLNLDARTIADEGVMVGVVTETIGATLDNLTAAISSETDPEIRKLYEDTLTTLSNPDNQKKLPGVMKQVMEDMSPEFAMGMNKSLETGDVKGLYTELIKKFPTAEKLKEFDAKMADKILVGGLGIIAMLAALLGTVAAAGMKPAR